MEDQEGEEGIEKENSKKDYRTEWLVGHLQD